MTKDEIFTQLRTAKTAHLQWLSDALALISGLATEHEHVPIAHTDCEFGKWYYGAGRKLSSLSAYRAIEAPHELLHRTYTQIFEILFAYDHRPLLSKLVLSSGRLNKKRRQEADALMQNLLSVSRTLLESMALLEQEVLSATDQALRSLPADNPEQGQEIAVFRQRSAAK